jgi:hypothetical protein
MQKVLEEFPGINKLFEKNINKLYCDINTESLVIPLEND